MLMKKERLGIMLARETGEIVRASFQDRSELWALESQCFHREIAFSRRQISYLLKSKRVEVYVVREEGRIIAEAIVLKRKTPGGEVARLYSFAVKPGYRGRGLGKRLLLNCLEVLHGEGIQTVYLEVEGDNHRAIALYESLGFRPIRELKGYYPENKDGIKMKLVL